MGAVHIRISGSSDSVLGTGQIHVFVRTLAVLGLRSDRERSGLIDEIFDGPVVQRVRVGFLEYVDHPGELRTTYKLEIGPAAVFQFDFNDSPRNKFSLLPDIVGTLPYSRPRRR